MTTQAAVVEHDIVIVGAGVAGLACAVEAVRSGRRVTIVEAAGAVGGASGISGGGCCIVDTPTQQDGGISDSVELALADWAAAAEGEADLAWAERYLHDSREWVWRWLGELGVQWQPAVRSYPGNSVPRWHRPHGGGGAVVGVLVSALRGRGARWCPRTRLLGAAVDAGGITLELVDEAGHSRHVRCRAVVVATGGFVNDATMIERHVGPDHPLASGFLSGGHETANGEGHRVLASLGADFTHMNHVWFYPVGVANYRYPGTNRGLVVRGICNDVWVNGAAERFHDESLRDGRRGSAALAAQPGQFCWGVTDSDEIRRTLLLGDGHFGTTEVTNPDRLDEFLLNCPDAVQDDTIDGLARKMHLPTDILSATLAAFNTRAGRRGADPATGRDLSLLRPIDRPPFHAYRYRLIAQKNFGGVRTDPDCAVLSASGEPIPGVFACGEVAGMAGGHINGRGAIEGTMFGPCLYSGRIAGRAAADFVARSEPTHLIST